MDIKELVNILGINDLAPFHFFKSEQTGSYAYCLHITKQELEDYCSGNRSKDKLYNEQELGVYIADVTIDELYESEYSGNRASVLIVLNEISKLLCINVNETKTAYAIYTTLHEIGHWIHFKESGKTSLEYFLWDSKDRGILEEMASELRNMSDISVEKGQKVQELNRLYKNISCEQEADKFAFKNIVDKINLVRKNTQNCN